MAANDTMNDPARSGGGEQGGNALSRTGKRLSTETKQFFKTSEWWTYVVIVIALLIAGNAVEAQEGGNDYFAADKVWLYITILTVGYFISRGLAKAGSRDPYWEQPTNGGRGAPITERVKAAAEALREPGDGNVH
jgi:hypothetical protein